jgi:SanA protein
MRSLHGYMIPGKETERRHHTETPPKVDSVCTLAMNTTKGAAPIVLLLGILSVPVLVDIFISLATKDRVYRDVVAIEPRRAALVLGTSKYASGRNNLYYEFRLDAVTELWDNRKIDAVLVSGDNSRTDYNEPRLMKQDLVARGIPEAYIALDYAGLRTLDSVVRASAVFMLDDFIVVSQPSHCQRALYIADAKHIKAVAYGARPIGGALGAKVRLREMLARSKAMLDLHVLNVQPRYLGEPEIVSYRTP